MPSKILSVGPQPIPSKEFSSALSIDSESTTDHFNDWPNAAGFNAEIEQRTPIELTVQGHIPAMAAGTLYRTGPGNHTIKDVKGKESFSCSHWFDGFSHLYRFQIIANPDGSSKVIYSSRRQTDHLIEIVRKTGKFEGITFAQRRDPCTTFFQKLKSTFEPSHSLRDPEAENVSVTITPNYPGVKSPKNSLSGTGSPRPDTLVTLTDSASIKSIDPETLEPIGVTNQKILHPSLSGPLSAAHAQFDHTTGDCYNYNLAFGATSVYRIFHTSVATQKTEILATISGADIKPSYIHSFFLTEDFVILVLWPSHFAASGASILWERNILDAIKFDPSAKSVWLVVDRKHGRGLVSKFQSPAAFSFHTINAWQETNQDGNIDAFCDVIMYPNFNVLSRLYYDNVTSNGPGASKYGGAKRDDIKPKLVRYRLASIPASSKLTATSPRSGSYPPAEPILSIPGEQIGELPTINPHFSTHKARFVYSLSDRGLSSFMDGIFKTDLDSGTAQLWECEHHTPGEPIFVPRPGGEDEDDGVLLSVVLDGDKGTSYLLCLDARTMKELGRADTGVTVGFGFHGNHLPAQL